MKVYENRNKSNSYELLKILLISFFVCSLTIQLSFAQHVPKDSFFLCKKSGLLKWVGNLLSCDDYTEIEAGSAKKNSTDFIAYKGKKINSIYIKNISFGNSIKDSKTLSKNYFTNLANQLHETTKCSFVAENLFFSLGDSLRPEILSENIRYLREQPYLQDALMKVEKNLLDSSSVDLIIQYKDVFSKNASAEINGKAVFANVGDENLFGLGQSFRINGMYDIDRNPNAGLGAIYTVRNFISKFSTLSLYAQNMDPSYSSGNREATSVGVSFSRPLVSQYYNWTGAADYLWQQSNNLYHSDSDYVTSYQYRFLQFDNWLGYNLSNYFNKQGFFYAKYKYFISGRSILRNFKNIPFRYINGKSLYYSDFSSAIGSFTIFKQDYYHSNFIYGFGRNEDVPEGINVSLLGGWVDKKNIQRSFFGLKSEFQMFTRQNNFINYHFNVGGYLNDGRAEDLEFLFFLNSFSKLFTLKNHKKVRNFYQLSLSHQENVRTNDLLSVNNNYGFAQINGDSLFLGTSRITAGVSSVFFLPAKFSGFSFAPFISAASTFMNNNGSSKNTVSGFHDISAGIRTRNENLIFGTIELRFSYFPRTVGNMPSFQVAINSGLQFKYNSQYISKPNEIIFQ